MIQRAFDFVPDDPAVPTKLRLHLEDAVRAITRGLDVRVGHYQNPVVIHETRAPRVQLDVDRFADLILVAGHMGQAEAVRLALLAVVDRADELIEARAKRRIGEVGEFDWRLAAATPEDFYAR